MIKITCSEQGYVRQRESTGLEFKKSFRKGDALMEYAKTLVAMANNQGGAIVFGVQDKPRTPIGLADRRFEDMDEKELNRVLLEYFSSDVNWSRDTLAVNGKTLGVISVIESDDKPIICSKNHDRSKLREGAIYYRYRAETKEIRYPELRAILQIERERERDLWMRHIQSIAKIGPRYAQLVDGSTGEMEVGDSRVIIDESLLEKVKLIKEGKFDKKDGAPTLKLVGEIEGVLTKDHIAYTETAYPYTQSMLVEELPINTYDFQALVWKLRLKGNPRFHAAIRTGARSEVQKYSEKALSELKRTLRDDADCVAEARREYGASRSKK